MLASNLFLVIRKTPIVKPVGKDKKKRKIDIFKLVEIFIFNLFWLSNNFRFYLWKNPWWRYFFSIFILVLQTLFQKSMAKLFTLSFFWPNVNGIRFIMKIIYYENLHRIYVRRRETWNKRLAHSYPTGLNPGNQKPQVGWTESW